MDIAVKRQDACKVMVREARAIINAEGATEASLTKIRDRLVALAGHGDALFPKVDFALPDGGGRNHPLELEDGDGLGLYLTINMPGKEAAPHDHGIWCVNAGISGQELNQFFRRTDDGAVPGKAAVELVGQVIVEPGCGMFMLDHAIHYTIVQGTEPAWGLALYGYALVRFPPVVWFHPGFGTTLASPSRRPAVAA